jgi:hypothetical protein
VQEGDNGRGATKRLEMFELALTRGNIIAEDQEATRRDQLGILTRVARMFDDSTMRAA